MISSGMTHRPQVQIKGPGLIADILLGWGRFLCTVRRDKARQLLVAFPVLHAQGRKYHLLNTAVASFRSLASASSASFCFFVKHRGSVTCLLAFCTMAGCVPTARRILCMYSIEAA